MKVTQESERTYTVVLGDAELADLNTEAKEREFTPLEIMKACFFNAFVQIVSCQWRRSLLGNIDRDKYKVKYEDEANIEQDGG